MKYFLYNFLFAKNIIPLEYLNDFYICYLKLFYLFKSFFKFLLFMLSIYLGLRFHSNYFISMILCDSSNEEEIIIGSSQIIKLVSILNSGIGSINHYFIMDISKIENFTPHTITDYAQIHSLLNNMHAMYESFRIISYFISVHNPGVFFEENFDYSEKSLNIIISCIKDIIPRIEEINKITESSRVIDHHHLHRVIGVHPYFRKKLNCFALPW